MTSEPRLPSTSQHCARPRVIVIEDDTLMRQRLLELEQFTMVAAYPTVEAFLGDLERPSADVVILDLLLHTTSGEPTDVRGVRAIRAIRSIGGDSGRILLYTAEHRRAVLATCLGAGAHGIVLKSEALDALITAIESVAAGQTSITTALTGFVELFHRRGLLPVVSGNKLEVLRGRARGEPFKVLGPRLGITPKTAETYMASVHQAFRDYLHQVGGDGVTSYGHLSPADVEKHLGLAPGDLAVTDPLHDR